MISPPTIFTQPHLGLGDMIVCNAIFRHFAETHNVVIPCKHHNLHSVNFMVRDLPVVVVGVSDDEQAKKLAVAYAKKGARVLKLGMFGDTPWSERNWDMCMFAQAGIPFEKRWTDWKVDRDLSREFEPPKEPYVFIHEDPDRGFIIDRTRLPDGAKVFASGGPGSGPIFNWCSLIENAEELHMIDSCFAILADSLPNLKAKRKVVHIYARKNALPPTYKQDWEILL